jgi:hypothetical protein
MRTTPGTLAPKALLAAVFPTLGGFVTILVEWIATGAFDRLELATTVGAFLAAALAFGGAWLGNPGSVEHVPVGPSSDDLLMADHEVRNRLTGPGIQTKRPG